MSVEPAVDELIIGQLSLLEEVFEGAEQTQRIVRELRHQRLLHLASLIVLPLPPVNNQVVTIKLNVALLQFSEVSTSRQTEKRGEASEPGPELCQVVVVWTPLACVEWSSVVARRGLISL